MSSNEYFERGNIKMKHLFLAPMADITDYSFRIICKEMGAGMVYSEFVSSDGIIEKIQSLDMIKFGGRKTNRNPNIW